MKLHDQHLHSRHSADSKADPAANCEQALAAGLSGLTFTEHYDMHPSERDQCKWNYDAIANTVAKLQQRYFPPLLIGLGIEVDFQPELRDETLDYLSGHHFDVVLLSVHWSGGRPLHLRRRWQQLDAAAMRRDYLATLRAAAEWCVELTGAGYCPFHIISHLDYVKRYLLSYWGEPLGRVEPALQTRSWRRSSPPAWCRRSTPPGCAGRRPRPTPSGQSCSATANLAGGR